MMVPMTAESASNGSWRPVLVIALSILFAIGLAGVATIPEGYVAELLSSYAAPGTGGPESSTEQHLGLMPCVRAVACGAQIDAVDQGLGTGAFGGASTGTLLCDAWDLVRIPSSEPPIVELPLLVWAQLHAAATWSLHFRRRCRGSVFPLHTSNAQFADSELLGPPAMQAMHGLRTLPFLAYTRLVVTQVPAALLCSAATFASAGLGDLPPAASRGAAGAPPLTLRAALCDPLPAHGEAPVGDEADSALLASLWQARPGASSLPVRLAAHIPGELARAAETPAAPGSALLRLLLQGSATPARPALPEGFPAACAPSSSRSIIMPPPSAGGCSLGTLVAWARTQLAAALDTSPFVGRLHNASAVAAALWAPTKGTFHAHERLADMAAAAAAGDARGVADAYYPRTRGRALPSLATFYNVALLADGAIVSVDEVLRDAKVYSRGEPGQRQPQRRAPLDACTLEALSVPEPAAVARCTNRSEAAYMLAVAARGPFTPPAAGGAAAGTDAECAVLGLSDAEAARVVAQSIARNVMVMTLPHTGEVAADPRLLPLGKRDGSGGSSSSGRRGECKPEGGWRCSISHALDRPTPPAAPLAMRVSPTFVKGLVFRPHFQAAWNVSAPTPLPRPEGAPPPAPASAEAVQAATPCPSPHPHPQQQRLPAVDLDAPLPPRALPVFDDVLHLDGPFMRNYFWWTAEGAATVALVRDWLDAFPHAVIHFNSATAFAWAGFHEKTLRLLGVDPWRAVFGPALARRVHVLDEAERWRNHPVLLLAWRDAAHRALDEGGCLAAGTSAALFRRLPRGPGEAVSPHPQCGAALAALEAASARARGGATQAGSGGSRISGGDPPVVLIVARSDAAERRWGSAAAVASALEGVGARVLYYSSDGTISGGVVSPLDGLALYAAADVVVASHGAGLVNALVLRPGATLIEVVPQGHAGYGLMYLWLTRLITGQAVNGATGNVSVAVPLEYHGFAAPGSKRVPVIEPNVEAIISWAMCAARLARRAAGTPACADMRLVDVLTASQM